MTFLQLNNAKQTLMLITFVLYTITLQAQQPNMFLYIADDQNPWDYGVH